MTGGDGDVPVSPVPVDRFLDAKLRPPALRDGWVDRRRLLHRLSESVDHPVTVIAAPAGYGKTTLLAQWLSHRDQSSIAWVTLDGADNDPVRLWTHIAVALARAGCPISDDPAKFVAANATRLEDTALPALVDALAARRDRLVVVLDDFHLIGDQACLEQLHFLIAHLPPSVTLVISTRSNPSLRLARLRVGGGVSELRAETLAFAENEAAAMLAREGVQLSAPALSELMIRTEGWPAGLYLAALSLIGRAEPNEFVRELSGNHRFIVDYLTEEVLSRQPEEIRSFITGVSILDRFSAPLCDHAFGRTGSPAAAPTARSLQPVRHPVGYRPELVQAASSLRRGGESRAGGR